jgi:cytochrome c oxidase subunit 1
MTFLIAIPTGVKFFNWIGTIWGGSVSFDTPMLWSIGFLTTFLFGGLTGIILASPALDYQLSDSYFVVAHFHYVVFGTVVFAMFAGFYYWSPKWTGVMYNETRGKIHFWSSLIFFNVTFFPMHFLGLAGMPRRYADYPMQFTDFNMLASIGAFGFGLSQVYFFFAVVLPMMRGKGETAPQQPWEGAEGLEWEVPSPAPFHTFETPPKLDVTATRIIA